MSIMPDIQLPLISNVRQLDYNLIATAMSEKNIPPEFYCPITCQVMRDPLMCRWGQNYERRAILLWLQQHNSTCPVTRRPLHVNDLVRNTALQGRIRAFFVANKISGDKCEFDEFDEFDNDDSSSVSSMDEPEVFVTGMLSFFVDTSNRAKYNKSSVTSAPSRRRDLDVLIANIRSRHMAKIMAAR